MKLFVSNGNNKLVNVEVRIYHNDACLIVCVISLSDNGSSFADNQPTRKFINVNKIKSKILNLFCHYSSQVEV